MDRARDLGKLESRLGVTFRNKELLRLSLVHSSYFYENPGAFAESNQRLEFLGDAVIGVAVAEQLFRRNPGWSEGELTHVRSTLVSGATLSEVARGLDLGRELYMGKGAEGVGTRDRSSCLAAALEAVVGAVFLDQGYGPASATLWRGSSRLKTARQLRRPYLRTPSRPCRSSCRAGARPRPHTSPRSPEARTMSPYSPPRSKSGERC